MILMPILWAHLFQRDLMRPLDELKMTNPAKVEAMTEPQHHVADLQRRLFEERFRKLVDAMQRFADTYDKAHGNVWPLKEADALKKACDNLERSLPSTARTKTGSGESLR
jgi:hypothetical protein